MKEFLILYTSHIIWTVGVIVTVVVLRFLTTLLHNWLVKKEVEKFPGETTEPVDLIKRILNTLWLVIGVIALGFVFVDREMDAVILDKIELVLYLGFLSVFVIVAAATTNMWFKKSIQRKIEYQYDYTSYKFLRYVAVFAIYFVGIIFALLAFPSMRVVANTALGGAGVIALIAGVASQEALANVVGGVFIIGFKPFKLGDVVKVTDTMVGTVTDITLRHTIIRNFENKMIVIPNSIINKEKLINYDLGDLKCCEHIEMGISYDSDVAMAKKIMQEECEKHSLIYDNRSEQDINDGKPMVKTAMIKINESTMTIRAWAWTRNFSDSFSLKCDVNETIKERFDAIGVDLAYPTRTIYLKNENELIEK
ncbi:mechanosensitive ion channel family protein [Maribacter sp. ACAM166]|uniref:mechanosensitive ion channel family protein n=1 Tax=Maribacter sp. ACAM166 TaxID=2508996 RepID=UPI0010FDC3FA|nr:mechanosensitive ion channel family protein [Maribacter sp. ACAM166]TLP70608.1 mechanosensitive ion channel family protein [Maribacter sp. ACAM166]